METKEITKPTTIFNWANLNPGKSNYTNYQTGDDIQMSKSEHV